MLKKLWKTTTKIIFVEEFTKGMENPYRSAGSKRNQHIKNMPKLRAAAIKKFMK